MQTISSRIKAIVKSDSIGWLLVLLGIALRLRQYIANRSFWHDEANLALNLVDRTFSGLTQPLDYDQGAPIGFLFIEKTFITLMGNKDYILRLFPLVSGLTAIVLIYLVVREYFKEGGLLATLIFSISWTLVYYSSELKQYSSDAMFVLLLIYLAFRCLKEDASLKDFLFLGVAGFFSIWISHPSAFILAGIGLVLFFEKLISKKYKAFIWTLGLGLAWAASFAGTYFVSLRYLVTDQSLENYWRHGFMPLPPWSNWDWYTKAYLSLLSTTNPGLDSGYFLFACSAFILIGIASIFLRDRKIALLITLPFVIASIASVLQKYPLKERFMLFLVPLVLILIAEGFGRIYLLLNKWNHRLAIGVYAFVPLWIIWIWCGSVYFNFINPPLGDHVKPVMEYVEHHMAPNDIVYVYHGARPSFNYYASFYGLTGDNVLTGLDLADAPALTQFYKQIDRLAGNDRVWILFSHIVDCGGCTGNMASFYIQYLDQFGKSIDHFGASGAEVFLYDLNP